MKALVLSLIALAAVAHIGWYLSTRHTLNSVKATVIPSEVKIAFEEWKQTYAQYYVDSQEDIYRLSVFYQNYKFVNRHQGQKYTLGLNEFAAMSNSEFQQQYLGYRGPDAHQNGVKITGNAPSAVDWRTKGAVSAIKNQGSCGSCWAFSTTGSLESADYIFKGTLGDFSEQQLVDCSTSFGNQGCNGGLMDQAFQYVIKNGITTEQAYPYEGVDQDCQPFTSTFTISGFTDIKEGDCASLQAAVAQQPVSVAVDAVSWQFYIGGIFPSSLCGKSLDHGVLAVGYDDKQHWIVKNSWGAAWGEKGYIRLAKGNTCGICNAASFPVV